MSMQAADVSFEALQASMERYCDLALDGLCDQAVDEQAASVLLDLAIDSEEEHCDQALGGLCDETIDELAASVLLGLELDCEACGCASRTPRRSWPDLEIPQVDLEPLHDWAPEQDIGLLRDGAPEGELDRAYHDLCASALKELQEHPYRPIGDLEPSNKLSCTSLHERLVQKVRKTVAEYMMWVI